MTDIRLLPEDASTIGLILVDIQNFTLATPTTPHTGETIRANAVKLAHRARQAGVTVFAVRVGGPHSAALGLHQTSDKALPTMNFPERNPTGFPEDLVEPTDIIVDKYNWGAFYGTDLDMQLRRRGITTLIVCGIASNYGVESTVRQAHEHHYAQVVVSDATAAFSEEEHRYPFEVIFPRVARVRSTDEVLAALDKASAGHR